MREDPALIALALEALRAYDMEVANVSFVAKAFNTVYRVDTADGSSYALRMSPALRIHADECEVGEAEWVAALRRDVNLAVPLVIRPRDGSVVVWASTPAVPDARSCVLFEWVPGRRLRDHITDDLVRTLGELAAVVHEHGATYLEEPPPGALIADQVCYFRAPPRLEQLRPKYGPVLEEAVVRAQETLDHLWRNPPHRPHLMHGDLQSGNVMVQGSDLTLIDFQDLIWGFEVQDVTIALVALKIHGDPGSWSAAFREGYEGVRPWPDADPDTIAALRSARHLNILNFGLSMNGPDLDAFVARHAAPVADWMAK